jgi:hypothetical protein
VALSPIARSSARAPRSSQVVDPACTTLQPSCGAATTPVTVTGLIWSVGPDGGAVGGSSVGGGTEDSGGVLVGTGLAVNDESAAGAVDAL